MTIGDALAAAAAELKSSAIPEARREARSLLAFVLGLPETAIFAHPEHELAVENAAAFEAVIARRAAREPFQYIVGRQEFYGREFVVTPDVLIPRPETEVLVAEAIKVASDGRVRAFCEIGVGSGCIALSILANTSETRAEAGDISDRALAVAAENAARLGVGDRIELQLADVFEGLRSNRFDMIVSNPPYVRLQDLATLQAEVRDHEPHVALTDGADGLSIIRRIILGAVSRLRPEGTLIMEIGWDQSESVKKLLSGAEWYDVRFIDDLQGIPRIVRARRSTV